MHWNNGRFHGDITVGKTIFITDHKHVAILGTKDYTSFGDTITNTNMYGKNINIDSSNKLTAGSKTGSNLWSNEYIRIESGVVAPDANDGNGIKIASSNGNISIITNNSDSINIDSGNYLNLKSKNGITVNNVSYGTTLPTSGVEGQIFFKLIS